MNELECKPLDAKERTIDALNIIFNAQVRIDALPEDISTIYKEKIADYQDDIKTIKQGLAQLVAEGTYGTGDKSSEKLFEETMEAVNRVKKHPIYIKHMIK